MTAGGVNIDRMDEPDDQPSLAGEIGRAAISVVAPIVEESASSVVLVVYLLVFVPIGLVAFIATGAIFSILMTVVGAPGGMLASILGLTWFGGTLVLLFALFVFIYRRLPRRLREPAAEPAPPVVRSPTAVPGPTLAELDARFAPDATLPPKDPPAQP